MPYTIEELSEKFKVELGTMHIDADVSRFERDVFLPKCPQCGNWLFLYNKTGKMDPFIQAKVEVGCLKEKELTDEDWIMTCWTEDCNFYIHLNEQDIVRCPECQRPCSDYYTLFDHMRAQCTKHAREDKTIRDAGAGMYLGNLVAMKFEEEK